MYLKKGFSVLAALILILSSVTLSGAKEMSNENLDAKQKSIVTIAAFTAGGEIDKLKTALAEGLDSGLTVNEIKEILAQMYAYAGFPRSLNGVMAFMDVLKEREAKGIKDVMGKEASPVPTDIDKDTYGAKVRAKLSGLDHIPEPVEWQKFIPVVDEYLKQHLFADIFARDVLTHEQREIATIGALANISGASGQLMYHIGAAMNTGLTKGQLDDYVEVLNAKVGKEQAETAKEVIKKVLASREK